MKGRAAEFQCLNMASRVPRRAARGVCPPHSWPVPTRDHPPPTDCKQPSSLVSPIQPCVLSCGQAAWHRAHSLHHLPHDKGSALSASPTGSRSLLSPVSCPAIRCVPSPFHSRFSTRFPRLDSPLRRVSVFTGEEKIQEGHP